MRQGEYSRPLFVFSKNLRKLKKATGLLLGFTIFQ